MEKRECQCCGASLDSESKHCKYCGADNPYYAPKKETVPPLKQIFAPITTPANNSSTVANTNNKKNFSVLLFLILLIFFWPAAIVYVLFASK